ncbi:MAG: NFACT RNA binding domain-containing protein [Oligoflexia bacterium]|nr:NFACT RNA binding domain-containing protein [Oligoflexia bacterium]
MPAPTPWPILNWKELALLVDQLRQRIEGLYLDRLIVPERPRFPEGYLKGEWILRFTGRKAEAELLLSVRSRHPAIVLLSGRGPRAAPEATHSAFDLALSKQLRGSRLLSVETLPRERTVILWFTSEGARDSRRLGLVLTLIPAAPEALLIEERETAPYPVLARSRTTATGEFTLPDGAKAPPSPEVRQALIATPESHAAAIDAALESEAFAARLVHAQRELRALLGQARDRSRQNEVSLHEGEKEPDWKIHGDLLKAVLGAPPPLLEQEGRHFRRVPDYLSDKEDAVREIPCDPRLSPAAQVERFYQLARRKQRRITEARNRLENFRTLAGELERASATPPAEGDWAALEKLERAARIAPRAAPGVPTGKGAKGGKKSSWLGKAVTSRDGWPIWVGRSKDENLELTFRHARGNDLWLHVRGKPGAHAVIPVQPGKSVPLQTLLDAATLVVYYSGGEKWGKTEVDYTFKKHVKRIKDSTEASYTHNKTLLIAPEPERLKRLLAPASES